MRRLLAFVFIAALFVSLVSHVDYFIVGEPLCGPICPDLGLQYWKRDCLGYVQRTNIIDGFTDRCFGIPIGEKKCFGYSTRGENVITEMKCPAP